MNRLRDVIDTAMSELSPAAPPPPPPPQPQQHKTAAAASEEVKDKGKDNSNDDETSSDHVEEDERIQKTMQHYFGTNKRSFSSSEDDEDDDEDDSSSDNSDYTNYDNIVKRFAADKRAEAKDCCQCEHPDFLSPDLNSKLHIETTNSELFKVPAVTYHLSPKAASLPLLPVLKSTTDNNLADKSLLNKLIISIVENDQIACTELFGEVNAAIVVKLRKWLYGTFATKLYQTMGPLVENQQEFIDPLVKLCQNIIATILSKLENISAYLDNFAFECLYRAYSAQINATSDVTWTVDYIHDHILYPLFVMENIMTPFKFQIPKSFNDATSADVFEMILRTKQIFYECPFVDLGEWLTIVKEQKFYVNIPTLNATTNDVDEQQLAGYFRSQSIFLALCVYTNEAYLQCNQTSFRKMMYNPIMVKKTFYKDNKDAPQIHADVNSSDVVRTQNISASNFRDLGNSQKFGRFTASVAEHLENEKKNHTGNIRPYHLSFNDVKMIETLVKYHLPGNIGLVNSHLRVQNMTSCITQSMIYGNRNEDMALKHYIEETKAETLPMGTFTCAALPTIAGTPDSLQFNDAKTEMTNIIEIKCPVDFKDKTCESVIEETLQHPKFSKKTKRPPPKKKLLTTDDDSSGSSKIISRNIDRAGFLQIQKDGTSLALVANKNHKYYDQCQTYMYLFNVDLCKLVVLFNNDVQIIDIKKDVDFRQKILHTQSSFLKLIWICEMYRAALNPNKGKDFQFYYNMCEDKAKATTN